MKRLFAALAVVVVAAAPSHAQLIHFYPFTTDVSDAVGTANGALQNGATVSGGILSLDGVDDFVQFSQHIVPTSGSYTVALFARQTSSQVGSFVEMISQGSTGGPGFYIGHDTANPSIIRASDSWLNTGVQFPSVGQFHHFALVVDSAGSASRLYIDGVLRNTLGAAITTTAGGTDTRFGRQFAPFNEFFRGDLDDVRIYSNALTTGEVAALASGAAAAAPEPSSLLLGVTGLLGMAWGYRRRLARRSA